MDGNRIGWPRSAMLLTLLAVAAGGCSRPLATLMVSAPNRINPYVTDSNPIPPIESMAAWSYGSTRPLKWPCTPRPGSTVG